MDVKLVGKGKRIAKVGYLAPIGYEMEFWDP